MDALEAAVAQLEQERSARHRERRHHRARLEAHGARWQPGCAHLALLDGWREGGVVPVQVQPVLLGGLHGGRERGAPGLLLATAVEDAQWPRRTVEEGAPFQEVNEGGPEGRLHLGGHKLIASAAVEEEGDGDPPAQQTAHDGADRQGEALQNVGNLIDVPPELGGQRGNADKGLVRKEGGSGSGVLHRHVFLVSHPVADEGPDQEGLGIAELEQEAGDGGGEERSPLQAGAGTVCLAAAEGASQRDCSPDSSRLHVGGSAKGEEEAATEESPEQEAAQASRSEVGGQGESSDCTDRERCGKWGKTGDAEYGLSRRGGNPVGLSGKDVSEPESNCRLSSGGHEARQSTPQKLHGICADMSREGASDDRARETAYALDRTSEARVLQEQQKNLGGGHSPARSESTAAESTRRKQQTVEVTGSGGSLGAAGGAVSGELAGKLASRRKWEQTWEEKGRHLWSSPSVAIKERPARGGVRRSLFGEERETDQDSTTQNAENIEDPHDFAERIERSSRPGNALTATSARKPEIVSLPTQPPTPNPLSTELARKLASRRKWEVSSEVTGSST